MKSAESAFVVDARVRLCQHRFIIVQNKTFPDFFCHK